MNVFTYFSVGRRIYSLQVLSLAAAFIAVFTIHASFSVQFAQAQQPLKLNLKPGTVTFVGGVGDIGSPDCNGGGMCRGVMLGENESLTSHSRADKFLAADTRFSMDNGALNLIITHVTSSKGTNIASIRTFPVDRDAELPRNVARSLGFAGVRVFKGHYPASMEGVFPVQAKFSNGLNAASIPAPRGERHASVSFEVLRQMNVSVVVLDANNNKVVTLMNNVTIEGSEMPQTLVWNGKNDAGKRLASGEYRVEIRCTLPESGASFAENVPFILAPVQIAH